MKVLIIACAVNEGQKLRWVAERVQKTIRAWNREPKLDFLIMDDGSTDGVPLEIQKSTGCIHLRNEERKGVGHSIRKAYQFGMENGYEILVTMAGNNKDNPDEVNRIIDPIFHDKADFVQGSRYLPGGDFGNMPFYRQIATRFIHPMLFSAISGKRITDSTNGFRAVRTSLLKDPRMLLNQGWLDHYELEPYLFCQAIRLGYRVTEAPVSKIYPDKKLGYSKMKPITGWWSILRPLFYLALRIKQ